MQRVVFQPRTSQGIQQGVSTLVNAIRPTLGPRPRLVALQEGMTGSIELLDGGGLIARRITEIPQRDADVGAMFLRQALWTLHEEIGDGTATAAVLFQTVYEEALRYIAAGGNAQRLRYYLEQGLRAILDVLSAMTVPVSGRAQLAQIAYSICYDRELADMLGEILDIVGPYGRVEIRGGRGRELSREYVEGVYWDRGALSRELLPRNADMRLELEEPAIVITDLDFEEPQHLMPALVVAAGAGCKALVIVANRLSERALGLLLLNRQQLGFNVVAVHTPEYSESQVGALEDLAILTGGRPFLKATGDTLRHLKPGDLGFARRAWVDFRTFGLIGGQGDPRALRQHVATLRAAHTRADQSSARKKFQERIGRLMGGTATLWIGDVTERAIAARQSLAERTTEALRAALREGVVPGGGVALLNCRAALGREFAAAAESEQRAAYRILSRALEEPLRTIIHNAGCDLSAALAAIDSAPPGYGFDVSQERVVDMTEAGIWDVAAVQKAAITSAVSSAALALTVDTIVHHKERDVVYTP